MLPELLKKFKESSQSGDLRLASGVLRSILVEPFKLPDLGKVNQEIEAKESDWKSYTGGRLKRIAILGGYTTQPIKALIRPIFLAEGFWSEIYEGTYNSFIIEPLDLTGPIYTFCPDIVIIASGTKNLSSFPGPGATDSSVRLMVEQELALYRSRWENIRNRTGALIIQHNFETPSTLPLGRLEARYRWSKTRFVNDLNEGFWACEGQGVRILDVAQLCAELGSGNWHQPRWYYHSKHGFDPVFVAQYGWALSGLVRGILGRTHKCLVTDLDNTLWGGVIGDDGLDGISLGSQSAEGEAHFDFNQYLKELHRLGVILAVSSKNELDVARDVFINHPQMPLKLPDFAVFLCNWERKSANLQHIASMLNIGVDSLVFVDDNPAECEEVRGALPEVTVIELKGDPASFQRRLQKLHLFTPLDLVKEDLLRQDSYLAQQDLNSFGSSAQSFNSYLSDLNMQVQIRVAQTGELPRIAQLFRKTNQFNLSGLIFTDEQLSDMCGGKKRTLLSVQLKDRLADHGLISTLVFQVIGDSLFIENWVMSCRVFNRTLEICVLLELVKLARKYGCLKVVLDCVKTSKNAYAQAQLVKLGFIPGDEGLKTKYVLDLSDMPLIETCIKSMDNHSWTLE